jgi:hypothetical protein
LSEFRRLAGQKKEDGKRSKKILAGPMARFEHELTDSGAIIKDERRFCQGK